MLGVAGFMGPFLDYLRPTKSPYLVIQFVAVMTICFKVSHQDLASLDTPRFFIPIFLLMIALIPLSFIQRDNVAKPEGESVPLADAAAQVENAKYENDLDSVFKFSRALCLASAVVMLFFYFQGTPPENWYSSIAYIMIIVQMATFLLYTTFRHFKGEDVSNLNLFQIAFITVVFFSGSTFIATQIHESDPAISYMYYCKSKTIEFTDAKVSKQTGDCANTSPPNSKIYRVTLSYSLDYRQLSFAFLAACWLAYEVFWLKTLLSMTSFGRRHVQQQSGT